MNNTTFAEIQRFRQPWVRIIVIVIALFSLISGLSPFFTGNYTGSGIVAALVGALIPLSVVLLFLFARLETTIDSTGITYRLFPLQLKTRHIVWDEVAEAYVRQYSPLREYGGWGIRYSLGKAGRAVNISGNKGLQLVFRDGRKLLIGTQRAEEITALLKEPGKTGT